MSAIGHFEGAARRRIAWMTLYGAAATYRDARNLLRYECKHGWTPPGSEVIFEDSYRTLEKGLGMIRRLQKRVPQPPPAGADRPDNRNPKETR